MTRSSSSELEPFDPEIERTFHRLRNLVKARISPKKERQEMEELLAFGASNVAEVGNEAALEQQGFQTIEEL